MKHLRVSAACAALLLASAGQAQAERAFGLTTQNGILVFDTDNPSTSVGGGPVTGLAANETLVAIDYQPLSREVLLLGNQSNVYRIDDSASDSLFSVTQVSGPLDPAFEGISYGFDFNPALASGEFARIITDTDDNRVISGFTGEYLGGPKTDVFYATGDSNEGVDPNIAGIAYDTNIAAAPGTQQYGIDASLGVLTTVANNAGTLETVGSLGIVGSITNELGFDISGATGTAFAAIQTGPNSQLYTVDLTSGLATSQGTIGSGDLIRGLTLVPVPEPTLIALVAIAGLGLVARPRVKA
ncbi:DUF4394 domain-containing protein [Pseudobythopirellula maris]|nr:DUF4394 domain-containing protein [Pseudobythopirellula maris]